jgi:transposase
MVEAVRTGKSIRAVTRQFRVSRPTVERWFTRAGAARLDRVEWADRSSTPRLVRRRAPPIEDRVLAVRRAIQTESALGEYGAAAIHRELVAAGITPSPRSGRLAGSSTAGGSSTDGAVPGSRRRPVGGTSRPWQPGRPSWTASTSSTA